MAYEPPDLMFNNTVIEELEIVGGTKLAPGVRLQGYIGLRRVEISLSVDVMKEIAAMYEPPQFRWPWET